MGRLHEAAWNGEEPDFSQLTYEELNDLQLWDAPGLPEQAHAAVLAEMSERLCSTAPCLTCGRRSPR